MTDVENEIASMEETSAPENPAEPRSFDLRRTDRISKDQFEQIQFLHDQFAKELSEALTVSFGVAATVTASGVEQVCFSDLVHQLEPVGCYLELQMSPMPAASVLALDAGLAFAALELLLGSKGGGEPVAIVRELTDIEKNLLDLVLRTFLEGFGRAWSVLSPVGFEIDKLRQRPQQLESIEPNEPLILATFDVTLDTATGKLRTGVPTLAAQMILRGLAEPQAEGADGEPAASPEDRMLSLLAEVPLTLDVRLDGGSVLVRNFAALKPGDVLALGAPVDKPVDCLVNDRPKFKGRIAASGGKIGFHIDSCE